MSCRRLLCAPSHSFHQAKLPIKKAKDSPSRGTQPELSSSPFSLQPRARSRPWTPNPFSPLPWYPVASGMSKSLRTCCPWPLSRLETLSQFWQVLGELGLHSPNPRAGSWVFSQLETLLTSAWGAHSQNFPSLTSPSGSSPGLDAGHPLTHKLTCTF